MHSPREVHVVRPKHPDGRVFHESTPLPSTPNGYYAIPYGTIQACCSHLNRGYVPTWIEFAAYGSFSPGVCQRLNCHSMQPSKDAEALKN